LLAADAERWLPKGPIAMRFIPISLAPVIMLVLATSTYAAQDSVALRWNVKKEIAYSTTIDTIRNKSSLAEEIASKSPASSDKPGNPPPDLIAELSKPRNYEMISTLFPLDSGDIAIELRIVEIKGKEEPNTEAGKALSELYKGMKGRLQFRAHINTKGDITSFWLPQPQKNIVSLMFQLPSAPVKVGDEWDIDVNFIHMSANFICSNSKFKNLAKLVDIKKEAEDMVASIEYDIYEKVEGTFDVLDSKPVTTMTFKGNADFLINKGRWRFFTGTMTTSVKQDFGNMSQESVQGYRLMPRN
jgi:hypothetical protein